ncbi:putative F-box/FBD/LRR-repeat protein At4g03220 [Lolium perenne]|uniref:putative F-box/FBD/LRR-repeat protein At4g03220 n=1 Tax=Lolium perenne TaxID=4522 RepID=UPI0021EB4F4A|nr:uncharacterized protein LOC127295906 [Lolium perenne]
MEHSDGEIAAPPEDRLSALPVDILIDILLKLRDAAAAAQTSGLSRHWRRLWAQLPELFFHPATRPNGIRAAIESNELLALRRLEVKVIHPTRESLAAWLPTAAPRLSGDLRIIKAAGRSETEDEAAQGAPLELPCFENATAIRLDLGNLALAMPPAGVFAGLTDLFLSGVDLRGPCMLGDAVSSPRCPALRKLAVHGASGLANFAIRSDSLLELELKHLKGDGALGLGNITIRSESLLQIGLIKVHDMQQLTVLAPALQVLNVTYCFAHGSTYSEPVANICAPQLMCLYWTDAYEPSSTQFGNIRNLKWLDTYPFLVYGQDSRRLSNDWCLGLMRRFESILYLRFILVYPLDITNAQYLMEDITRFPDIEGLALEIKPKGHSFGASVFHVLRMCTGVKRLRFTLMDVISHTEAQSACPSDCVCDQLPNWKTQELALNCLQEVTIHKLNGTEHEAALIKRLFDWATALENMTIAFHDSVPKRKAKEFFQMLQSFSRPDIRMKGPHFA